MHARDKPMARDDKRDGKDAARRAGPWNVIDMRAGRTIRRGRSSRDRPPASALHRLIGERLVEAYAEALREPVPVRIEALVCVLDPARSVLMASRDKLKDELIRAIPSLRAFGVSLCGNAERSDDLVQETLMKAWANLNSFAEGTNLAAWLFTILRNAFYSEFRKRRREVEDAEGRLAGKLASMPAQNGHMDLQDFRHALMSLPASQREVLVLVGGSGMSYEEVAAICGCAVGTVKSRVNRARVRLAKLLSVNCSMISALTGWCRRRWSGAFPRACGSGPVPAGGCKGASPIVNRARHVSRPAGRCGTFPHRDRAGRRAMQP